MSRFGTLAQQYFDNSGKPLAGGKIYFYEPGTTTDKTTYSDEALSVANAQPVVLDASGRQSDVFFDGQAKAVLTDSDDVQIRVADPVGVEPVEQFPLWNSASTYSEDALVQASDGLFYLSLGDSNQGNDPTTTTGFWSRTDLIRAYSASATYNEDMIVVHSGALYQCDADGTTNVTPDATASEWSLLYNSIDLSDFTLTGTLAQFNTALSDGSFATLAGAETLINKTIDGPSVDGAVTLEVFTITDGASVTLDPANGSRQKWTLGASRTPSLTISTGQGFLLYVDDGSGFSLDLSGVVDEWIGGTVALATSGYTAIWIEDIGSHVIAMGRN